MAQTKIKRKTRGGLKSGPRTKRSYIRRIDRPEERRLARDLKEIRICTECGYKLDYGETRRFVHWKTTNGKAGLSPWSSVRNLVCVPCKENHDLRRKG